jgi:tetratricopeptide (TPR) repeat protein
VDCSLELKVQAFMTNFRSQVQMKATTSVTLTKAGYVPFSVSSANLNLLLNGTCPAYLLWDESADTFWYAWAFDEYGRLTKENPSWRSQETITLQFRDKLTSETLPKFEQRILEQGRFLRGLHDLIASEGQTSASSQSAPTLQRAFQVLSRYGGTGPLLSGTFRQPIPENVADFERLCLDLLRRHWSRPDLALFGRPRERDQGIDILDLGGQESVYAAMILLNKDKSVSPREIETAVENARQFQPPLGKFGILATGKFSVEAQRKVRDLNETHRNSGMFEVELFGGEKISQLLQLYPEIYSQYFGQPIQARAPLLEPGFVSIPQASEPITSKIGGDEVDALIDEARDAVNQHSYQMAILLLNRIELQKGDLLTPYQRFRVVSNKGFATLGQGDPKQASKYFLEALDFQPGDEKARTNEVLAYYIVNDRETAFQKAVELRVSYPSSARLAAYWILTSPIDKPTSDFEQELTTELLEDGQVRTALASKALSRHELDLAEEHANNAVSMDPAEGQPQLVLAKVYMAQLIDLEVGRPIASTKSKLELLELGEKCGREAARLAESSNDVQSQIEARVLLVDVLLMQSKTESAVQEADKAYHLSPDNVQSLVARSQVQFATAQPDAGIASLERAYSVEDHAEVAFNYGNALLTRSKDKDLEIAIEVLTAVDLSTVVPMMRHPVATQTLRALMKKQDWARGHQYLDSVSGLIEPDSEAVLRGLLAHYEGLPKEAEHYALKCQSSLSSSSSLELKVFLARLFMLIGLPAEALPLFKEAFDANMPSFDYGYLLDCAARLARDGVIIGAFRTLRARGVDDWSTISFGVQYLQKYHSQEAVDALDAYLERHPDHKLAKLSRSVIGLLTNRSELVSGAIDELPSVNELPVDNVVQVVHVLRFVKEPDAAVDYAYRFLRLHFKEPNAHRAILIAMTPFEPSPTFPPTLDVVDVGSAVRFEELPIGDPEWRVIENTNDPSSDFEEIAADSKLALELMGKHVGDTFLLAPGIIDRRGRILQIVPKYVRRYNDCGDRWQIRFPEEPMVEAVRLGSTEEQIRQNVEKVLQSFQKRAELEVEMRKTYSTVATPLHIFGSWHGKNAYVAMVSLSAERSQPVRVSFGTMDERNGALAALRTAAAVVMDLSSIATLRLLSMEKILTTNRFRFLITQTTLRELRETLNRPESESSPSLAIQFLDGKQIAHEETVDFKKLRGKADKEFLELVERHCETVPVIELASFDSPKRETLEKAFGQYGLETMMLAAKPDHILWTDDLVQAQLAITEFGVRRVWTQTLLVFLAELGIVTAKERDLATAKMIGMEYQITYFDVSAILEAVELTDAKPWTAPLKNFVDEFGAPNADLNALFPILTELVVRLYREAILPESRCTVITAFLDAVWKNSNGRRSLLNLRSNTQRLFGLNFVGQAQFDGCFDRWYKLIENPLVPG